MKDLTDTGLCLEYAIEKGFRNIMILGGFGGLIGVFLGFAFAQYVSRNVFSSSITFQFWLLPVTVLASILVTGLACLFPVRSATEVDPALVLKGE